MCVPVVCDWCNLSIHGQENHLDLNSLDWGMAWNDRDSDDWEKRSSYENQEYEGIGEYGRFFGHTRKSFASYEIDDFDPEYFSITVRGSSIRRASLDSRLEELSRTSSAGDTTIKPTGHFCGECLEIIVKECKECSMRAVPPCEDDSWMGFTSKHIFTGDMKQSPVMIAVCSAKLKCIDCEDDYNSMHFVYIGYNSDRDFEYKVEWDEYEEEDVGTDERWNPDDLALGRGPMVDYLRRGEWNSWIFNAYDEYGNREDIIVPCPMHNGALTKSGWVCYECD